MDEKKTLWVRLTDWNESPIVKEIREWRLSIAIATVEYYIKEDLGKEKGGDNDLIKKAIKKIGLLDDGSNIPYLLDVTRGTGWYEDQVVEAVKDIGEAGISKVIECLSHNIAGVQLIASSVLGKIGDKRAVPALIERFKTADPNLKIWILNALAEMKDPRAVPALIEYLENRPEYADKYFDREVRSSVAWALGAIGDDRAVPILIETLNEDEQKIRCAAAKSLIKLGYPRNAGFLIEILVESLMDENEVVREDAAEECLEIGEPLIVLLVNRFKDEQHDIRESACYAFESIAQACKTTEDLEAVEKGIIEASKALRKGPGHKMILIEAQLKVADLLKQIAEKKNEFAAKRDLLLPDTVKPPKKGDVYNSIRKMRVLG